MRNSKSSHVTGAKGGGTAVLTAVVQASSRDEAVMDLRSGVVSKAGSQFREGLSQCSMSDIILSCWTRRDRLDPLTVCIASKSFFFSRPLWLYLQ